MRNILSHLPGCSAADIDDVIIFSPNWKTHIDHIRAVLDALRVARLTANPLTRVSGHHVGMVNRGFPKKELEQLRIMLDQPLKKG